MKISACSQKTNADLSLIPGENLFTGIKSFSKEFNDATSLENDLLNLASSIYASDLAVRRQEREEFIRDIELTVEVVNIHAFEGIKNHLEQALLELSSDNWTIIFIAKNGEPEKLQKWTANKGSILLFSGGLDSYVGAASILEKKENLVLVSHTNQNKVISSSQNVLYQKLKEYYKTESKYFPLRVFGRNKDKFKFPTDNERENTQRTRSFLFLSLASLAARRYGFRKIITMAENGQFAIHLPLNQSRVGPFSTQTAHPKFLNLAQEIFEKLLDLQNLKIINPFLYLTKAEVISKLNSKLYPSIPSTVSCWKSSRVATKKNHCGECIPCLSRRIAVEYNGLEFDEYKRDIFTEDIKNLPPDDNGKRNLIDLVEFLTKFNNYSKSDFDNILNDFPELYNEHIDQKKAVELYRRLAKEAFLVFRKYPKVNEIIT
ncbi:MAG: 7-cyano-7-deazaguanine synthase [Candidatus Scalindua sp.]